MFSKQLLAILYLSSHCRQSKKAFPSLIKVLNYKEGKVMNFVNLPRAFKISCQPMQNSLLSPVQMYHELKYWQFRKKTVYRCAKRSVNQ